MKKDLLMFLFLAFLDVFAHCLLVQLVQFTSVLVQELIPKTNPHRLLQLFPF